MTDEGSLSWKFWQRRETGWLRCEALAAPLLAARTAWEGAFNKNRSTPQIRRLHNPAQFFSHVGRYPMAIVQPVFGNCKLRVWIEHDEVCIVASGDLAFARATRQ